MPSRPGGEPLSYKAFIAQLPDNVSPQEAEQRCGPPCLSVHCVRTRDTCSHLRCRYAAYKRERGVQFHRSYWQAHKDDEWLRQQFDPRRLELLLGERNIAARDAALGFDVQSALKHQASAGEPTGEPQARGHSARLFHRAGPAIRWCSDCVTVQSPEKAIQRLAHDVAQAHRLIQTLDAEKVRLVGHWARQAGKRELPCRPRTEPCVECWASPQGIETAAALLAAVQDCAAQGDQDVGVLRTALHACVSYLWLVHGADYFQGDLRCAAATCQVPTFTDPCGCGPSVHTRC